VVVGAQYLEIVRPRILGIAVDVIDFDQRSAIVRMALVPTAKFASVVGAPKHPFANPRLELACRASVSWQLAR